MTQNGALCTLILNEETVHTVKSIVTLLRAGGAARPLWRTAASTARKQTQNVHSSFV